MNTEPIEVRVARREAAADEIVCLELVPPGGGVLPAFEAGSHIDVHLPGGAVRQYSLCNDPSERHRYRIAVLRETGGRGGSGAIHDGIREGDLLRISAPRNSFRLLEAAPYSLLLAGGIGVTPILSMALRLARIGADFAFHYCTRGRARTAFHDELQAGPLRERVQFHFDDGPPAQHLDLRALLGHRPDGAELYVCGPAGFMAAVVTASAPAWPATHVHREYFSHDPKAGHDQDGVFRVRLARSGREFDIPGDKTIVEVLRANGIDIPVSCEQGICGTCVTPVLEGTPDHRDLFMTDAEHAANDKLTPCCSRARSALLVLDL